MEGKVGESLDGDGHTSSVVNWSDKRTGPSTTRHRSQGVTSMMIPGVTQPEPQAHRGAMVHTNDYMTAAPQL